MGDSGCSSASCLNKWVIQVVHPLPV